jgi:cytoskeletal protein RodZ
MDNTTRQAPRPDSARRLGDILRETRIAKGLELSDVAEVTHVRKEYLKALDEGRYQDLPEDVYARNFVRLYAQTLGISDTQLLEKFKRERHSAAQSAGQSAGQSAAPPPPPRAPVIGADPNVATAKAPARQPSPAPERAAEEPSTAQGETPGEAPRRAPRPAPPDTSAVTPGVIPVTRRSSRDTTPANTMPAKLPSKLSSSLDRDFWTGDPSKRRGSPLLWLLALTVLLAALGVWWAATNLRPGPAEVAPEAPPGTTASPSIIPLAPSSEAPSPAVPEGGTAPSSVTLSISSTPPGAEVSVDNFYLGNTPLQFPIRARESGVVRLSLEGHETAEFSETLATDRSFNVELQPLADGAAEVPATAAGGEGNIVITVESAPSWLEVWSGGARNEGERLLYTTAQPGQRFEFPLPVYVHAGAASSIRVSLNGQSAGTLGSGGEVVGRLFR